MWDRRGADLDQLHRLVGTVTARIEQSLAIHRIDLDVGDQQFFAQQRRTRSQCPLGVKHHAAAVEDELVLPADLVDVHQCAAGVGRPRRKHAFALAHLSGVIRRAVDVDIQLGAASRLLGQRPRRAPHVLADADANLHPADDVQLIRITGVAGHEVARLIEHRIVGQHSLAVCADHLAADAHCCRVVEIAIAGDVSDDRSAPAGARRYFAERGQIVGDEARLEHQVLRRIAGDRQLAERNDVASGRLGLVVGGENPGDIAVEIADRRVQLCQCNSQPCHRARLPRPLKAAEGERQQVASPGSTPTA